MADISLEKDTEKILKSIDGCLSVSAHSCDECMFNDVSQPRCIKLLLREASEIIKRYSGRMTGEGN